MEMTENDHHIRKSPYIGWNKSDARSIILLDLSSCGLCHPTGSVTLRALSSCGTCHPERSEGSAFGWREILHFT